MFSINYVTRLVFSVKTQWILTCQADSRRTLTSDVLVLFPGTHMWFVVNEVALGRVFFFRSSPVSNTSLMFHYNLHINTILIRRTSGWRNAVSDIWDFWAEKYLQVVFFHVFLTVSTGAVWSKYENRTTFINDIDPEDRDNKFLRDIDTHR